MNWVVFCVLLGLVIFNLLGVGIHHYEWKHAVPYKDWRCKEFYIWTTYLILFGTAYCVLRLILLIIEKIKKINGKYK